MITDYHDAEQWWVYGDDSMDATQWIDFDVDVEGFRVEVKEAGETMISKGFSEAIPQGAVGLATFNRDAMFDDFSIDEAQYQVSRVFTNAPDTVGDIIIVREYTAPESYTDTWFHYDALGNVMSHSNASGVATATYDQDAYGNVINASTGAWLDESSQAGFHLTTKEYDLDIALYFFAQRYVDPCTGRFTTKSKISPLLEWQYVFAEDSPINYVDPTGLWGFCLPFPKKNVKWTKTYVDKHWRLVSQIIQEILPGQAVLCHWRFRKHHWKVGEMTKIYSCWDSKCGWYKKKKVSQISKGGYYYANPETPAHLRLPMGEYSRGLWFCESADLPREYWNYVDEDPITRLPVRR